MTENLLKPGERLDDLQRNGLHIIQHPRAFRFGMTRCFLQILPGSGPVNG